VITFRPVRRDQYAWTFRPAPRPVARGPAPARGGSRCSPRTASPAGVAKARPTWSPRSASFPYLNPQTGPLLDRGAPSRATPWAVPLSILESSRPRDWGRVHQPFPLFGRAERQPTATRAWLHDPLPELVWLVAVRHRARGLCRVHRPDAATFTNGPADRAPWHGTVGGRPRANLEVRRRPPGARRPSAATWTPPERWRGRDHLLPGA